MARPKPILEEIFDAQQPFDDQEDELAQHADALLRDFEEAPMSGKLIRLWRWKKAVCHVVYRYHEVKDIPTADLRIIAKLSASDPMNTKYAEKIKSPLTGIRAFCINCQGGSLRDVRNCTSINCVLYPFRMGSNPFYGRTLDADAVAEDIELPEEEETTDGHQEA